MIREWLKILIMECLKECIKKEPRIISHRAPTSSDLYEKGTLWVNGKNAYKAEKTEVTWKKIEPTGCDSDYGEV